MDEVAERIRAKHAAKQERKSEAHKERQENGVEKSLLVERAPTGLYSVVFEGGGRVPDEFQGKFTSIDKLRNMVMQRYGKDILVCQ
jgi:hypothetical protein